MLAAGRERVRLRSLWAEILGKRSGQVEQSVASDSEEGFNTVRILRNVLARGDGRKRITAPFVVRVFD